MEKIRYLDYISIIEKLSECYNAYFARSLNYKKVDLFLANGERLSYIIPTNKLAHLLGVDTNYLLSTSCFTTVSKSSKEMLDYICNAGNGQYVYNKITANYLDFNKMFSDNIKQKLDAFNDNILPNAYQAEFVCKVDSNICHNNGTNPIHADYLVCSKDESNNYLILGLVKENNNYVPSSNQLYTNIDELKAGLGYLIEGQEMTILTGTTLRKTNDYDLKQNIVLKPKDKIEKVRNISDYSKNFGANLSIINDYIYAIRQGGELFENITTIAGLMSEGKTITSDVLSTLPSLKGYSKGIIDAYNDLLNRGGKSGSTTCSYSKLQKSHEKLKTDFGALKDELERLKAETSKKDEERLLLIEERDAYKSAIETSQKGFQKTLNKFKDRKDI